mgnify:CR=1 FL=1
MSQSERHAPGHALVLGGGTMGVGIIAMFLGGGWKVDVVSRSAGTRDGLPAACAKALAAMGKSTDQLIDLAHEVSDAPHEREMDMLLSTGERVTIAELRSAIKGDDRDVIEKKLEALAQAFQRAGAAERLPEEKITIGTAKTNVGHLDAAAGITGLIHAAHIVRDGERMSVPVFTVDRMKVLKRPEGV